MIAYYLTRPLTIRNTVQSRRFLAATQVGAPSATELYIAGQDELRLLRTALQAAYPQEPLDRLVRVLSPNSVAKLPGMPALLGARAFVNPAAEAPDNCLIAQLQALRSAQPGRRHYRLLLNNAFGTNLGDNLMGVTAFRQVRAVLREQLPSVSMDVLLGWHSDDRLTRMFQQVDGVECIRTQGPTFAELAGYQAVFDTGNLLHLPGYGERPMVDWYLWWMGLDPAGIAPVEKRNAVAISAADREWVAAHLPAAGGPRLLINPMASVALRCMPEAATLRLVETLIASWPEAQILLIQPLPLAHPRVHHLAEIINTSERLAALVAVVEGLIGVDTYTAHLADATSTPAVTLFTSVSPDLYPYYPLNEAVVLPKAETLSAWGKMKVTPEAWNVIAGSYEAAWATLDFTTVVTALRRCIAKKTLSPEKFEPRLRLHRTAPSVCPTRVIDANGFSLTLPLRQREEPLVRVLHATIDKVAAQVLSQGDTVAFLGAGCGESALGLARRVGPHGRLVAIEPRRALHQLLCANLIRAGIWHAETHCVMPEGETILRRDIRGLDLAEESLPLLLSNNEQPDPVLCWPFDALSLTACRLLVVSSPLARLAVLQGAGATLERLQPYVLVGVVALSGEGAAFESFFKALPYRLRTVELGNADAPGESARYGILVAEPIDG